MALSDHLKWDKEDLCWRLDGRRVVDGARVICRGKTIDVSATIEARSRGRLLTVVIADAADVFDVEVTEETGEHMSGWPVSPPRVRTSCERASIEWPESD